MNILEVNPNVTKVSKNYNITFEIKKEAFPIEDVIVAMKGFRNVFGENDNIAQLQVVALMNTIFDTVDSASYQNDAFLNELDLYIRSIFKSSMDPPRIPIEFTKYIQSEMLAYFMQHRKNNMIAIINDYASSFIQFTSFEPLITDIDIARAVVAMNIKNVRFVDDANIDVKSIVIDKLFKMKPALVQWGYNIFPDEWLPLEIILWNILQSRNRIFLPGRQMENQRPKFQHSEIIVPHPVAIAFLIELCCNLGEYVRSCLDEYIDSNSEHSELLKKTRDGYLKHKGTFTISYDEFIDHANECNLTKYLEKRYLNYKNKDGFYFF